MQKWRTEAKNNKLHEVLHYQDQKCWEKHLLFKLPLPYTAIYSLQNPWKIYSINGGSTKNSQNYIYTLCLEGNFERKKGSTH